MRPRGSRVAAVVLALVAACSSNDRAAVPTAPSTSVSATTSLPGTVPTSASAASSVTAAVPAATTVAAPTSTGTAPATTSASATTTATTTAGRTVDVAVYLVRDGRLAITHRSVEPPAVLRGALAALLAGPTAAESAAGLTTAVPSGTALRDVAVASGLATVDLTSSYGSGGGSLSMAARLAQVVFTATQFDNAERVTFRLDGRPIDSLGGEGLAVSPPRTRATVDHAITGSVLVDSPAPGATVHSPIVVRGEADVYEAEFPIEIWAGGRQIGGVTGVRAGAWGTWRSFETSISLDAAAGPIELVAYDPGGCGDAPECPPIVKTVVPLTLAS